MSGRKCSEFQLQREREMQLKLLQAVTNAHGELNAMKARLAATLGDASEGLRSTFREETALAEEWLRRVTLPELKGLGMDTNAASLQRMRSDLDSFIAKGRNLQETLTTAFTQKADAMGKQLSKRLAETEQLYSHYEALLRQWFDTEQMERWTQALRSVHNQVEGEEYSDAERAIAGLQQEFSAKGTFAELQEEKHQKRMYLLKALRQVCADMGFEEISAPRRESEQSRGSRITFKVDTLDRGRIEFTLSLDGISSCSEIADNQCFEEFDKLSGFLDNKFGIQTQFRLADGTPRPELKRRGELDLPDGASQQLTK